MLAAVLGRCEADGNGRGWPRGLAVCRLWVVDVG